MLDELLAIGSSFDWVTPWKDLYKDLSNGPHHDFYISRYSRWSAGKIRRLLKKRGVGMWGLSYTEDMITIRVRENQAKWAQYLLLEAEVPVIGGLVGVEDINAYQSQSKSRSTSKSAKRKSDDPFDSIGKAFKAFRKDLGF